MTTAPNEEATKWTEMVPPAAILANDDGEGRDTGELETPASGGHCLPPSTGAAHDHSVFDPDHHVTHPSSLVPRQAPPAPTRVNTHEDEEDARFLGQTSAPGSKVVTTPPVGQVTTTLAPGQRLNVVNFKTPKETLLAARQVGTAKAKLSFDKLFILAILAGVYIAFGSLLAISVGSPGALPGYPSGIQKLIFGGVFPVGLMLVVVAGAELFTGNTAMVVPGLFGGNHTHRSVSLLGIFKNWSIVYMGNFCGSLIVAFFLVYLSDMLTGDVAQSARDIAEKKVSLEWQVVLLRAIGCNWLVCLAVWMATAAEDVVGKLFAVWFPISAFVSIGYEHCVANMFFIPVGLMLNADATVWEFIWRNLIPCTIGNIIGGSFNVGTLYWYVYGRDDPSWATKTEEFIKSAVMQPPKFIMSQVVSKRRKNTTGSDTTAV